jgi:streptogramin lyase
VATALATGPDGNAWFVENNPDFTISNVGRVTPAGQVAEFPLPPRTDPGGRQAPALPSDIAAGAGNTLWVAVVGGVDQIDTTGRATRAIPFGFPVGYSTQLAVPGDGSVWLASADTGALVHVATSGAVSAVPLPAGARADGAIGVASDGHVYVLPTSDSGIWRVTGAGAPLRTPLTADVFNAFGWDVNQLMPEGSTRLVAGPGQTLWLAAGLSAGGGTSQRPALIDIGGRCVVPDLAGLGVTDLDALGMRQTRRGAGGSTLQPWQDQGAVCHAHEDRLRAPPGGERYRRWGTGRDHARHAGRQAEPALLTVPVFGSE